MSDKKENELNEYLTAGSSDSLREESAKVARPIAGREDCETVAEDPEQLVCSSVAKMWAVAGNEYFPCEQAVDELPVGQYTIESSQMRGIYFNKKDVTLDSLLTLPDSASEDILEHIEQFWTREQHYRDFGFLWKRGIMLWGPPGSGKTSTLQLVSNQVIQKGGIAVYVTVPHIAAKGLEMLRIVEPKRPLVVMLEDIDAIIENYGEADLLAILDGELQIDNVVFIATTNYPERLDKRFKNRPSRFDIVKKIGMPNRDARRIFLLNKNPRLKENEEELRLWVDKTDGFSIAHIKELIVSVEVFGVSFEEAHERLYTMINIEFSAEDGYERKFGFV